MSSSIFLVLPNQLFNTKILKLYLKKNDIPTKGLKFVIVEDPVYFGFRESKMNFNKKKLILHFASMKYYYDYLHQNKFDVEYIELDECLKNKATFYNQSMFKKNKTYCFDPVDHLLMRKIKKNKNIEILDSPLFLNTNESLEEYHKSKKNEDNYFHSSFYKWQKKSLNVLPNEKSYDSMNQNKIPKDIKVPPLPKITKCEFITRACARVNKQFGKNYGSVDDYVFPINHRDSLIFLKHFCEKKLQLFGQYQDAIDTSRNFLYHSCLSPMINIGLLTPMEVLTYVKSYYSKNSKMVKIQNYEGFIRQLIGWREYQRYIYLYGYKKMTSLNHFGNKKKLNSNWYKGTTGLLPLDDAIKMAFKDGYLHHILRLMVVGNLMNLVGIHPKEAYTWFMEFAVDSYDWVMIGNVYSMAMWSDGGLSMRKPYISGDGYVMNKVGNYSRGDWNKIWLSLFYNFIARNQKQISKTYYNGMIKNWNNKSKTDRDEITKISGKFIKDNTK
jgi:deoxyribodipyrimidine photolyase-related protein